MKGTSIKNLSFSYPGDTRLTLKDIDLEVEAGEFVCLLGQSGCGKSTLLRLLAGLEKPTVGELTQDGKPIEGAGLERGVVFQSYGLFPWITAGNNIMLALKQRYKNMTKAQHKEIAMKAIRAVGLDEAVFDRLPKELSGGMKQRCAIAQAFAINPAVLLMDEPFGALDAVTRARLQEMVLELWASQEQKKTVFFVTHDVDEALLLVLVMALGLVACGAPATPAADVAMQYIKAEEAKELLNDAGYVFFDIRKAADASANSIPGAEAWDMDAAKEGDAEAGKATMTEATKGLDKKIILVCYSGKRYAQAATNALSAIGYDMSKVYTLEGGFTNWSEVLPELTTAGAVEAPKTAAPELNKIRLNWGGSGNILWALAIENGYLADEGIEVEFVQATNNDDMLTLLQTGMVDIRTNAGTAAPLSWQTFRALTTLSSKHSC